MGRWRTTHGSTRHVGASLKPTLAGQRGTSVVEILTSTVFVSVLMAISYSFVRTAFLSARLQEGRSEAQEVAAMAMDLLTRELRMAGFSAAGTPVTGVRFAGPERVEVAADFDGDGDSDESNELIAYSYNAAKRQLVRATGGASPQPLVGNVPAGGLRFSFFDAAGAEIAAAGAATPVEERLRIRRIDVVLHTESPADPAGSEPTAVTVSSSICLRNQGTDR